MNRPDEETGAGPAALDAATLQIHHPYEPPSGFAAVVPAVHKASTVLFRDAAALRARSWKARDSYSYGLLGTPTTYTLEQRIATLEGGLHCALTSSGLSAITLVNLAVLKAGDEVLLPYNVYGPSREQAHKLLAGFGIGHALYDPLQPQSLRAAMSSRSRLVWIEPPGSVTMEFPDIRALVEAAHAAGALCALDNTWGAGVAFAPFEFGVDISMHALTKYPSGGGDVLMGAVVTRDPTLSERILHIHSVMGLGVAANDCETVLRSLPTMRLRYEAHDRAARDLAAWLATQPAVRRVLHPALPGAPGHDHWRRHCSAAAGLFSLQFDPRFGHAEVDRFVDALRLFGLGVSWGGPMSLVVPYDLTAMRGPSAAMQGPLVRLSIGLEAVEDLRADLAQALKIAFGC
jgi:cystathionine beta-lyase